MYHHRELDQAARASFTHPKTSRQNSTCPFVFRYVSSFSKIETKQHHPCHETPNQIHQFPGLPRCSFLGIPDGSAKRSNNSAPPKASVSNLRMLPNTWVILHPHILQIELSYYMLLSLSCLLSVLRMMGVLHDVHGQWIATSWDGDFRFHFTTNCMEATNAVPARLRPGAKRKDFSNPDILQGFI